MLLFLIVILTAISIALRITIGSLEVAFYIAERANSIRKSTEDVVLSASKHVGRKTYKTVKGSKFVIDTGFVVINTVSHALKPAVKLTLKTTLRVTKFIVTSLRNAFILLEGLFLVLDLVIFIILVVSTAGYLVLFCNVDDAGNIVFNDELVLESYIGTSSNDSNEEIISSNSNFIKYELSNEEIRKISNLCYQEQSSVAGAAAEASLMCNLFESSRGVNYSSVYDYVRNSGWFARAPHYMDNGHCSEEIVSVVANVINQGYRVLPKYVDEHDCFSDIVSATNEGKSINSKNRNEYKKNITKMSNRYGSNYTFYCFPDKISDPFGYTSEDLRLEYGDACYTLEEARNGSSN